MEKKLKGKFGVGSEELPSKFRQYRLKPSCIEHLKQYIKPDKIDMIIANMEYYGSRVCEKLNSEEQSAAFSFFDNEFDASWIKMPEGEELRDFFECVQDDPEILTQHAILCRSLAGENDKVSLIISGVCFEEDQLFTDRVAIN